MSDDEDHDDPGAGRLDAAGEERAAPSPRAAGRPSRRQRARPARARPARRRGEGGGARGRYRRRRVVALPVAAIVVFAAWFLIELFQPFGGPGSGIVTVDIPSGANASEIGDVLAAHGVIDSSFFFSLRARLDGDGPKLRHGVITMRHDMSYAAALSPLTSTPAVTQIRVTIPEGFTRGQIAALANTDGLRGNYLVASRPATAGSRRRPGALRRDFAPGGIPVPDTYFVFPHENVTASSPSSCRPSSRTSPS